MEKLLQYTWSLMKSLWSLTTLLLVIAIWVTLAFAAMVLVTFLPDALLARPTDALSALLTAALRNLTESKDQVFVAVAAVVAAGVGVTQHRLQLWRAKQDIRNRARDWADEVVGAFQAAIDHCFVLERLAYRTQACGGTGAGAESAPGSTNGKTGTPPDHGECQQSKPNEAAAPPDGDCGTCRETARLADARLRFLILAGRLSELIDRGRFHFENDRSSRFGKWKEPAYQGLRHPALDVLDKPRKRLAAAAKPDKCACPCCLEQIREDLVNQRRAFVSHVQRFVQPAASMREIHLT